MYRIVLASCVLIFSACAASDPPTVVSTAAEPVVSAPADAAEPGQIEFAEPPVPPESVAVAPAAEPEVICQLERRTGTNRKVRVCRQQSSATDAARAQATFDSLRRQQIEQNRPTRE